MARNAPWYYKFPDRVGVMISDSPEHQGIFPPSLVGGQSSLDSAKPAGTIIHAEDEAQVRIAATLGSKVKTGDCRRTPK